jgi:hypothetical protein
MAWPEHTAGLAHHRPLPTGVPRTAHNPAVLYGSRVVGLVINVAPERVICVCHPW